jgi:metal-responsive CopG/Arc/MetJ family transcriptional regulator
MAAVKTAVSLDEDLLARIDRAADELRLARSRLLARAAEEFLAEHESRKMLAGLDRAYTGEQTAEEEELRRRQRGRHRRALEGSR